MKIAEILPFFDCECDVEISDIDAPIEKMTIFKGKIQEISDNKNILNANLEGIVPLSEDYVVLLIGRNKL